MKVVVTEIIDGNATTKEVEPVAKVKAKVDAKTIADLIRKVSKEEDRTD